MKEHKSKYSRKSRRLKNWNYTDNGYYFITICTQGRKCFFGKIINESMIHSSKGIVAEKYLTGIGEQFPFVKTDKFVVMPNHIHVILSMNNSSDQNAINRVTTTSTGGFSRNNNPMLNNGISKVVRWYKGRVTFEIRKTNPNFSWQSNYHDHVIRNEKSYLEIYEYITNNPLKWSLDRFNPINQSL